MGPRRPHGRGWGGGLEKHNATGGPREQGGSGPAPLQSTGRLSVEKKRVREAVGAFKSGGGWQWVRLGSHTSLCFVVASPQTVALAGGD